MEAEGNGRLTAAEGGFFSSTDADSEGEEGRFFVWRAEEIAEALGPERAGIFGAYYGVRPEGNWEGVTILHVPRPLAEVAATLIMRQVRDLPVLREGRLVGIIGMQDIIEQIAWPGPEHEDQS